MSRSVVGCDCARDLQSGKSTVASVSFRTCLFTCTTDYVVHTSTLNHLACNTIATHTTRNNKLFFCFGLALSIKIQFLIFGVCVCARLVYDLPINTK